MTPGGAVGGQGLNSERSGVEPGWNVGGDGDVEFWEGCGMAAGVMEQ